MVNCDSSITSGWIKSKFNGAGQRRPDRYRAVCSHCHCPIRTGLQFLLSEQGYSAVKAGSFLPLKHSCSLEYLLADGTKQEEVTKIYITQGTLNIYKLSFSFLRNTLHSLCRNHASGSSLKATSSQCLVPSPAPAHPDSLPMLLLSSRPTRMNGWLEPSVGRALCLPYSMTNY